MLNLLAWLGALLIFSVSYLLYKAENESIQRDYSAQIELVATTLEREISLNLEVLYQLESLYINLPSVSDEAFSKTSKLAVSRHDSIQAIEWIPLVKEQNRASFEQQRQQHYPSFQITERNSNKVMVPAQKRAEYYPVSIVVPQKGNEAAIGFDLASNDSRKATLTQSAKSGEMQATAGINLVQIKGKDKGFLVFLPIYQADESPAGEEKQLKGFVLGVFQSTQLLQAAIIDSIKGHSHLQLIDITDGASQLLTEQKLDEQQYSQIEITIPLKSIAGRMWSLKAIASSDYISQHQSHLPYITFILGMIFLMGIMKYISHVLTVSEKIEVQVNLRTKELNDSHLFIKKLTDAVPTLLAYVDNRERFEFVNKNYQKVYQVSGDNIKGTTVSSTLSQDKYILFKSYIDAALNGKVTSFIDEMVVNDNAYWLKVTYTPDVDDTHTVSGFFVSIEDITEQKQAEETLARYASDLEFKSWALEEAKDKAEAATQTKSSFLANMSHEIRTPLNGMLGMLSLINQSDLTDKQQDYIRLAQSSADILLTIINDILDISKIEAGKMTLEKRPFNLAQLLTNYADVYQAMALEKGILFSLESRIDKALFISADEVRIRQILNNLTSNAIKFTEQGEVHVLVELLPLQHNDYQLKIAVTDSGIGIKPEGVKHLFVAFEQQDISTTRKYGGTGLGLTICQAIAHMMSGQITVDSQYGKGSCFTCTIEVERVEHADVNDKPLLEGTTTGLIDKRILLVEDNRINQVVATEMLSKLGCTVTKASHGEEALEVLGTDSFDLILMDCMMPVMDGYQATASIRKQNIKSPIIAMTANAMKGDKQKCLDAGMNDYIAKPISIEKLEQTLGQWLI